MEFLPFEILDKILSYVDGYSLANSACVCRKWRNLLATHRYNFQWKSVCLREFSSEAIADLIGHPSKKKKDLEFGDCSDNIKWKDVYKECYRSRFIGKWPSLGTELKGHSGQVYAVKFSGGRVVTGGADATVRIWDSWTGSCLRILRGHSGDVFCLALRRKEGVSTHEDLPHDLIISGSDDFYVYIWNIRTGRLIRQLRQSARVKSVAVSGSMIIAGLSNHVAEVWDISEESSIEPICSVNANDWIAHVGFWEEHFVTVTDSNKLDFWTLTGEHITSVIHRTQNIITCAALRGDRTLTLSYNGKLSAWEHEMVDGDIKFSVLRCYNIIAAGIAGMLEGTCIALYGNLVAIGTKHGMINVYYLERDWDKQFQLIHTVIHGIELTNFTAIDISDDGTGPCMVSAGYDGTVRVERWFPWPSD